MAKIGFAVALVTLIIVAIIGIILYQFAGKIGSAITRIFKRK